MTTTDGKNTIGLSERPQKLT